MLIVRTLTIEPWKPVLVPQLELLGPGQSHNDGSKLMSNAPLFCHLSTEKITELIQDAKESVCYAGPGIQVKPAQAMSDVAKRLGPEMVTVTLDFDEHVMRMGYGDIEAVKILKEADIVINSTPSLRSALIIVDKKKGFIFTPTALYLEAESNSDEARNALCLSPEQITEALVRLSPATRALVMRQTRDPEEKARLNALPVDVHPKSIEDKEFKQVKESLDKRPPAKFDVSRQVRVYTALLQYVELRLKGAAIQRRRFEIPKCLQGLGRDYLKERLTTTYKLNEQDGDISSDTLEDLLEEIRKKFTRKVRNDRLVLMEEKLRLEKRLEDFNLSVDKHKKIVASKIKNVIEKSKDELIKHYLPLVVRNPPEELRDRLSLHYLSDRDKITRDWLEGELKKIFPKEESFIKGMKFDYKFKDITYADLNKKDFLEKVREAFPDHDHEWDKAHEEYMAVGEKQSS